jgi:phospholipase C
MAEERAEHKRVFGDGTRIPLLVVSPYTRPGHISHDYTDHVSILKFIARNWSPSRVTSRSRDNFPNPVTDAGNPYVPDERAVWRLTSPGGKLIDWDAKDAQSAVEKCRTENETVTKLCAQSNSASHIPVLVYGSRHCFEQIRLNCIQHCQCANMNAVEKGQAGKGKPGHLPPGRLCLHT